MSNASFSNLSLNSNSPSSAIVPISDILGSRENFVASNVVSPLDCYNRMSVIETYREESYYYETGPDGQQDQVYGCRVKFDLPMFAGDEVRYYEDYS